MMSLNPYEPPALPAEMLELPWPPPGAYRDGRYLVVHHQATLPPICVRTGQVAETWRSYELVGGHPNDGSVPPTRKKWFGDRVYTIVVPLSNRSVRREQFFRRTAFLLTAVLLPALVAAVCFLETLQRLQIAEGVFLGLLASLIACLVFLGESRKHLQLECVARGFFWIAKAPQSYLRQLPAWPLPRPSWWRRAFFGPAGLSTPQPAIKPAVMAEVLEGFQD